MNLDNVLLNAVKQYDFHLNSCQCHLCGGGKRRSAEYIHHIKRANYFGNSIKFVQRMQQNALCARTRACTPH